jgi:class II lanthipeptide synthase
MSDYTAQFERVIRAVAILSPTSYSWFGRRSERPAAAALRALTPQTARAYLRYQLRLQFYRDFYLHGCAQPARPDAAGFSLSGLTPFIEALSAANSGTGYWEEGWEVRAIAEGKVVAQRDGLTLWVQPEECLVPEGVRLGPGTPVGLRFPKEFLGLSPGYYMARSNKPLRRDDPATRARFFCNLTAEGAALFIRQSTALLNQAGLPFQLKVLGDPDRYTRCDAAVVYCLRADYPTAVAILVRVYAACSSHVKPSIPAFTLPLAPGLALAEDPVEEESFGLHRCGLLADGLIRAYELGRESVQERLRAVADHFADAGIDLDTPYLNPGSRDDYRIERQQAHSPPGVG